jgi:hypothetical protein
MTSTATCEVEQRSSKRRNADAIRRLATVELPAQALLVVLATAVLAWSFAHVTPRQWHAPAAAEVVLQGQHYRVPAEELRWLESFSALHFSAGAQAARAIAAAQIDAHLERVFSHALERVPAFADWYYSLRGEYSRAAMAVWSVASGVEPGYVANQAAAMLLPDQTWAESFERLERETAAALSAQQTQVREAWLDAVTRRLSAHRVPAPLPSGAAHATPQLPLDAFVHDLVARERGVLNRRLSLSTVAAGASAAAAPALWRAAAARASAGAGRAAAARAAARGASRAGAAAAGGAALCSPGGPLAFGCALFAGAAVWLVTDWALLEIDESLHRDDLVAALEAGLVALRARIREDLLDAYDERVAASALDAQISRTFVPARAGGAATD